MPLSFDGDAATAWPTLTYRGSAAFGNLKDGVGVVYDLGSEQQLAGATLASTLPGATVELRAAPGPDGDLADFPVLAEGTLEETTEFTFDGSGVESFDSFEVVESGTYSFQCDSPAVVASIDASGVLSGVGGVLLAVVGGGFGGLLALVGIVLWIIAGREPKTV